MPKYNWVLTLILVLVAVFASDCVSEHSEQVEERAGEAVSEPAIEEPGPIEPEAAPVVEAPTIRERIAKLPNGLITFKSPLKMNEGVEYHVEVRITADKDINRTAFSEGLEGPGITRIKEVKVGDEMEVSLEGDNEIFKIVPLFDTSKYYTYVGEPYNVWMWEVTPLRKGSHKLLLNVCVRIPDTNTWHNVIVMSETIDVSVSYTYRIKNLVNTKIELQWLIGAIIIPIVLYKWRSRKRNT